MNPFRISTRLQAPARQRQGRGAVERGVQALRPAADAARLSVPQGVRAPGPGVRAAPPPSAQPEAEPGAFPVPWRVTARSSSGVIEVEHRGVAPLHSVRLALAGGGMLGLSLPRTVYPGERVRAVLRGTDAERALGTADAMLVLRWFEPSGRELLWPISL